MEINRKDILSGIFVLTLSFLTGFLGGGCGGSTEATPVTQKVISFTPSGTPSNNSVYFEQVSITNDEITLAVKIKGGADVYAHALEINFDGSKIQYLSGSAGNYLNQDGKTTSGFYDNKSYIGTSGVLTLGDSRQGTVFGVAGDGILCQIVLKALVQQANTAITLNSTNSLLKSPGGNITGTSWIGGSLSY